MWSFRASCNAESSDRVVVKTVSVIASLPTCDAHRCYLSPSTQATSCLSMFPGSNISRHNQTGAERTSLLPRGCCADTDEGNWKPKQGHGESTSGPEPRKHLHLHLDFTCVHTSSVLARRDHERPCLQGTRKSRTVSRLSGYASYQYTRGSRLLHAAKDGTERYTPLLPVSGRMNCM